MFCDWEGNRRSGVALAMRHRLKWFIHLRAHGLSKEDEHPTNTPHWGYGTLYLLAYDIEGDKSIITIITIRTFIGLYRPVMASLA